jgi:hypothetical protein
VILNDDPSLFYWSPSFNADYRNNLWVVDKQAHTLFYISKEQETWNAIFKVSGKDGVPGMRNGNIAIASFNTPSSLAIYDKNLTKILMSQFLKPVLLSDLSLPCKYIDSSNYTKCGIIIDKN